MFLGTAIKRKRGSVDRLTRDELEKLLDVAYQNSAVRGLMLRFKAMLSEKKADTFDTWLDEGQKRNSTIFQTFIHGLRLD